MNTKLIQFLETTNNLELELDFLANNFNEKIVFSTSFGIEDQVISHEIFSQNLNNIEVFTLDTGRFFAETYAVWDKTLLQYNKKINAYYPNTEKVENYVNENGINAFYNTIELRKECCFIRKVAPLGRALKGAKIWITGLRAEQSENRNTLKKIEWDEERQLYKYNPLLNWSTEDVVTYLKKFGVPYNTLHDENFVSIGCAPCTRALKPGEDFRAGRWWWEDKTKKECGLHR
ncbi:MULTISPECIES: phosphoadenylyl-sulfate reductase [unclassified Flavobacterium]|jgi:phosphoadenosine phosphosulfate reductase|uniref:phosphoadenylyl-sulfate reductase n=1 Tax=unclassified Flavobacterium TaxID=196869 RepID=UPI0012916812|nr:MULTISPECIES: phosphoadenylyl-sulfate reductase [unclassified Flavobacterium]MQP53342.1 phosphoadenylyl-sulfate reductase [Flavobacterium sp. LMO9]MQP62222.1 phosphoadenylyl-sulfate reductase [Flavobacterium sp. LMO6]